MRRRSEIRQPPGLAAWKQQIPSRGRVSEIWNLQESALLLRRLVSHQPRQAITRSVPDVIRRQQRRIDAARKVVDEKLMRPQVTVRQPVEFRREPIYGMDG